jgi:hypothetical protein
MKKIVFAVQVFGLIVALPLYLFTELNQVSTATPLTEKIPKVSESNEMSVSTALTDTTVVFERLYLTFKKQNNIIVKTIN